MFCFVFFLLVHYFYSSFSPSFLFLCLSVLPEIPLWLKDYVDAPFGSEMDTQIQVSFTCVVPTLKYTYENLYTVSDRQSVAVGKLSIILL